MSEGSQVGQTLMSIEPVIIPDTTQETRFELPKHLTDHNVISGASVAINSGQEVYGILGAYTAHRRTFTDDQIHFMQAIANVLAAAISRRQAEVALRESEARYRQLIELSPEMIVVYDDEQVLYTNQAGASLIGRRSCPDHRQAEPRRVERDPLHARAPASAGNPAQRQARAGRPARAARWRHDAPRSRPPRIPTWAAAPSRPSSAT